VTQIRTGHVRVFTAYKSFISKTIPARSILKKVQHNIIPVYAVLLYEVGKGMNQ